MKCSMKGGEMWGYPNHALCVDIFLKNCACEYAVVIGCDVMWPGWHLRKNHSARGIFAKNAGEFNIFNIRFNKNKNKNKKYSILKNINKLCLINFKLFVVDNCQYFSPSARVYVFKKFFRLFLLPIDISLSKLKFSKNKGYIKNADFIID